jgi:hypothetical protein
MRLTDQRRQRALEGFAGCMGSALLHVRLSPRSARGKHKERIGGV